MARDLTSAMQTALQGSSIRPVLIGRLDFASDPITAWNGPGIFAPSGSGDDALDGQTFTRVEAFIEVGPAIEDQGVGSPLEIVAAGHDLDEEALRQIVRDKRAWRGRKAWLWAGLLNENQATVIASPARIKAGVMTHVSVFRRGDEAGVRITVDADLSNAKAPAYRIQDHTRIHPADLFATYIVKLANKPQGLGREPGRGFNGWETTNNPRANGNPNFDR